jgi:hypothetical protein
MDGHLTPEWRLIGTPLMDAGEELGVPNTVMRFRFADGSPYPQTINGQTASEWKLVPDPTDPERVIWEPHQ